MTGQATAHSPRRRLALGLSAGVTVLWLVAIAAASLQETAERILPLAVIELIDN